MYQYIGISVLNRRKELQKQERQLVEQRKQEKLKVLKRAGIQVNKLEKRD